MSVYETNAKILHCIYSLMFFTDGECRIIIFKEPIENKAMTGHVIRSEKVADQGSCRLMCYLEHDCVSINYGPLEGGKYTCELNSATEENKLAVLENRETYTFLAIEVNILLLELSTNYYYFAAAAAAAAATTTTSTTTTSTTTTTYYYYFYYYYDDYYYYC